MSLGDEAGYVVMVYMISYLSSNGVMEPRVFLLESVILASS